MRVTAREDGILVRAIGGTHVVTLGMSATTKARDGLLGFAIRRTDLTEGERYWLRGMKTFEAVEPNPRPGGSYSLHEHPAQTFRWADYTAKPGHEYIYEVVPMRGKPKSLEEGPPVAVRVHTEAEGDQAAIHDVYFNRGVAASQAYSTRFGHVSPSKLPADKAAQAFAWLSRGLEEAMLAFIGQAKGGGWGLRAAVYEFNHDPVLRAFKKAKEAGVDVRIVYDARKEHPRDETVDALRRVGIEAIATGREVGSAISHNKFIVLLRGNKPVAVWTGSTNMTASGIYGQSNVGHVVREPTVAQAYLDYWSELAKDPTYAQLRKWIQGHTPDPTGKPQKGSTVLFSPRSGLGVLEWYAERLDAAKSCGQMTAAFGVHDLFEAVLGKQRPHLRYVLLEKRDEDQATWTRDRDVLAAVGSRIAGDTLYGWVRENTHFGRHVKYIHNKFLLIDPLSEDPIVITGSANFSKASTTINDENMLVIRGDTRVADIYLGEFMRLFSHHYFRDLAQKQAGADVPTIGSKFLDPTPKWANRYFVPYSVKLKERRLFSGATS